MVGVVIISHGGMAEGIVSSASMLVPQLGQVIHLALWPEDNPDDFQKKLEAGIKEVDDGSGVLILADMLGGTPSNRAMYSLNENTRMLTGLSLPMLYTLLSIREETNDLDSIVSEVLEEARNAILDINELLKEQGGS